MKLKEVFKYNRAAGIIALILVIMVSVFLDANLTIARERKDVRKAYKNADFSTAVEKCADEMTLLCAEAEKLGINTTRGKNAADELDSRKKNPDGAGEAFSAVLSYAVSIYDEIKTTPFPDDESTSAILTAAKKHYDAIGQQLYKLAADPKYNKESDGYNKETGRWLSTILAPWFSESTDFAGLYEKYKAKFPDIKTETVESTGGFFDELLESLGNLSGAATGAAGTAVGIVSKILTFFVKILVAIINWIVRHFVLAIIILVIVLGIIGKTGKK